MVAAWIRADTGVGPSIASGSHTCSGNCADLPTVPIKISSEIAVAALIPKNVVWLCNRSSNAGLKICPSAVPKVNDPAWVYR